MNSRLTLGLAIVLLAGAVIAGYQGLKLSAAGSQSSTAHVAPVESGTMISPSPTLPRMDMVTESEPRTPVVVLAKELAPLVPIQASDLRVEQLRIAPPDSFRSPDEVIGRTVPHRLSAGVVLNKSSFEVGGPLARMIGREERALAISVDEVVAGGGFIRPGDYVDVLLYLRENNHHRQQTAQVVVPALRVLSYGQELGLSNKGEPVNYESRDPKRKRRNSGSPPGTAVLAVPQSLLTRFMLAAEVGKLRLAVRSAEEPLLANYYAHGVSHPSPGSTRLQEVEQQLFHFAALAQPQAQRPASRPRPARPARIHIHRGTDVSTHTP